MSGRACSESRRRVSRRRARARGRPRPGDRRDGPRQGEWPAAGRHHRADDDALRQSVPLLQDDHRRAGRLPALGVTPEGRLRRRDQELLAGAKDGPPYVPSLQHVGDAPGSASVRKDFALKRGAWRAGGSSIARPAGRSLRNSITSSSEDNPHLKDYPGYGTTPLPEAVRHRRER